jgi:hypothetical protein
MDNATGNKDVSAAGPAGFIARLSASAANALRYWEPRRLVYNVVLASVVAAHVVLAWPGSREKLTFDVLLLMVLLAVLANVAYCAVYVADLFVQFSGLDAAWRRGRVAVLVVGTTFAAIITHFIMEANL